MVLRIFGRVVFYDFRLILGDLSMFSWVILADLLMMFGDFRMILGDLSESQLWKIS